MNIDSSHPAARLPAALHAHALLQPPSDLVPTGSSGCTIAQAARAWACNEDKPRPYASAHAAMPPGAHENLRNAIRRGDLAAAAAHLKLADPNLRFADGQLPLEAAIRGAHLQVLLALLNARANPNLATSVGGMRPLALAAARGDLPAAQALAEAGAELEHRDHNGRDALAHALLAGQHAVVQCLLKLGARPDKGKHRRTLTASAAPTAAVPSFPQPAAA
ncbi:MAG TPA: ankyrin repeat domain-containing protein [Noviherbaspirillum sp.]